MIDVTTIMEQLTGQALSNSLIEFLEQHFNDFREIREKYREAIAHMERGQEMAEAIEAQNTSDLLFSAALGLKANMDHFRDPVARTFLEVDPEIYLRESVAHIMPQYVEAQKVRDTIAVNDAIINYTTYLETFGPKLAHFLGYLLGNELFPQVVPGFCCDHLLTMRYTKMIDDYCGCSVSGKH